MTTSEKPQEFTNVGKFAISLMDELTLLNPKLIGFEQSVKFIVDRWNYVRNSCDDQG